MFKWVIAQVLTCAKLTGPLLTYATCCCSRFVGEVTRVDPTLLKSLANNGYIPVVATVATDHTGQALNVNADTAAGEVRVELPSEMGEPNHLSWF